MKDSGCKNIADCFSKDQGPLSYEEHICITIHYKSQIMGSCPANDKLVVTSN